MDNHFGKYAFVVGLVIAIVLGVFPSQIGGGAAAWLNTLLVVTGIIVGFTNVTEKHLNEFILCVTGLVLMAYAGSTQVGSWGNIQLIGPWLRDIFNNLMVFLVPTGVTTALRKIMLMLQGKQAA